MHFVHKTAHAKANYGEIAKSYARRESEGSHKYKIGGAKLI